MFIPDRRDEPGSARFIVSLREDGPLACVSGSMESSGYQQIVFSHPILLLSSNRPEAGRAKRAALGGARLRSPFDFSRASYGEVSP